MCEDQKIGVILLFLLKILQEGRREKLGQRVPSDLRYVTKPYKVVFDVWVRKTLIHPWDLLMVGLGWYLDVIGSDSHDVFRVLRIFGEKSQKGKNH